MTFHISGSNEDKYCKVEVFDEDGANDDDIGQAQFLIRTDILGYRQRKEVLMLKNKKAG